MEKHDDLAHQMADLMHLDGNGEKYEEHLKTVAGDNKVDVEAVHKACEAVLKDSINRNTRYPVMKSQFARLFEGGLA